MNLIHFLLLLLSFQLARSWMNTQKITKVVGALNVDYFFVAATRNSFQKIQFKRKKQLN